jgi:hypothetical protein
VDLFLLSLRASGKKPINIFTHEIAPLSFSLKAWMKGAVIVVSGCDY